MRQFSSIMDLAMHICLLNLDNFLCIKLCIYTESHGFVTTIVSEMQQSFYM